ncbi:MAG: diacylglycerol/lipid kinase family protein [Gemmatimonadales bacterium]
MRYDPGTATYVTVVHNPGSGTRGPDRDRLVRLLGDEGFAVTYRSTKEKGWEHVLDDPGDLVLVAGGDGTVGHVAERLVGRGIPLALLSLGTANNIAKSLGLTISPEDSIAGLRRAPARPFDAGTVSGPWGTRHFLEGVGLGLFARTMCLVDERAAAGRIEPAEGEAALTRDLRYLARVLEQLQPQSWQIEADGEDRSGEYLICEVMNIRSVGPNLTLAPEADSSDGRLDLVLARPGDRHQLQAYLAARIAGREASLDLEVERVQRVRIVAGGQEVQVDDETERPSEDPGAVGASLDIGVEPGALQVLMPAADDGAAGGR